MKPAALSSILVLSTGGTFNKHYNPLTGELEVDGGHRALEDLSRRWLTPIRYREIIGKDSLEMTDSDREELLQTIRESKEERILVIHGTDTIDLSARYLAERQEEEKRILLTGAMIPYSIDPVEATANFALAAGFLLAESHPGVYLAMHGQVGPWQTLVKNRERGIFQPAV
ncbi:asparaginase domain-containing protein [Nitratifractor sp.]